MLLQNLSSRLIVNQGDPLVLESCSETLKIREYGYHHSIVHSEFNNEFKRLFVLFTNATVLCIDNYFYKSLAVLLINTLYNVLLDNNLLLGHYLVYQKMVIQ